MRLETGLLGCACPDDLVPRALTRTRAMWTLPPSRSMQSFWLKVAGQSDFDGTCSDGHDNAQMMNRVEPQRTLH